MYEPSEDSELIRKHIKDYISQNSLVLDIGTGSGILAKEALNYANKVVAVDIDDEVLKYVRQIFKEFIKKKQLRVYKSDLFSNKALNTVFDLIVFNPPYLPDDGYSRDIALIGGKHGYEIIKRFIEDLNPHLDEEGTALLVFSTLTVPNKINDFLERNLFEFKLIDEYKLFFEKLFIYEIRKSRTLKNLNSAGLKDIKFFARGRRGFVFKAKLNNKEVAIKVKNPKSKAQNKIENEGKCLATVNKYKIGPKLISFSKEYVIYEFVDGTIMKDFIETSKDDELNKVILIILKQLYKLDKLGLEKQEMLRPYSNLIITKKGPVLIDFERCKKSHSYKNITQFIQFLKQDNIAKRLGLDKNFLHRFSREYKSQKSIKTLEKEIKKNK
jgi:HemK-related putative methylase